MVFFLLLPNENFYIDMRIRIAGASGFPGQTLSETLTKRNHEVIPLSVYGRELSTFIILPSKKPRKRFSESRFILYPPSLFLLLKTDTEPSKKVFWRLYSRSINSFIMG